MRYFPVILIVPFILANCSGQNSVPSEHSDLGGPCEGCEAIYEYGHRHLDHIDTLPRWHESEPKLKITGTVYKEDGKTPAENVILYIYHTNKRGLYETRVDSDGWERRHGFIRGWVKTGNDGQYTFHTFRPSAYPNRNEPGHIHFIIKEPNKKEYYIDDVVFNDDPHINQAFLDQLKYRGGSGLVSPQIEGGTQVIIRDVILGLNIPNYD